jgi:hypothetical protein
VGVGSMLARFRFEEQPENTKEKKMASLYL